MWELLPTPRAAWDGRRKQDSAAINLGLRTSCLASAWMQGPYLGHASFDAPTCANHSYISSLSCVSAAQSLAHAMHNVCCMLVASPRLPIDGLGRTALPAHPRSGFEPETFPFQTRILDWDIGFDCRDCRDERRRFRNEDEVSVGDEVAACCGEFARRRSASCTSIRIEMEGEGKLLVCVPSWKPMEGRGRLCDRR